MKTYGDPNQGRIVKCKLPGAYLLLLLVQRPAWGAPIGKRESLKFTAEFLENLHCRRLQDLGLDGWSFAGRSVWSTMGATILASLKNCKPDRHRSSSVRRGKGDTVGRKVCSDRYRARTRRAKQWAAHLHAASWGTMAFQYGEWNDGSAIYGLSRDNHSQIYSAACESFLFLYTRSGIKMF